MLSKLKGLADVSVTATPQAVVFPDALAPYTIRNKGANSIYFIFDPVNIAQGDVSTFAGNATALKALGASELRSGTQAIIPPGLPHIHVACATGLTSTLAVEAGIHHVLDVA